MHCERNELKLDLDWSREEKQIVLDEVAAVRVAFLSIQHYIQQTIPFKIE